MPQFIAKPSESEIAYYYHGYLQRVADNANLLELLQTRMKVATEIWEKIPPSKELFAYSENKWTVKQILGHIIDTEQIMAYRTLCIARGEKTPLPGFEQDYYVKNASFNQIPYQNLLEQWQAVRKSNVLLFESLPEESLMRLGNASGKEVSTRALICVILGHEMHHTQILQERYL